MADYTLSDYAGDVISLSLGQSSPLTITETIDPAIALSSNITTNLPNLATVATTGSYTDLSSKPLTQKVTVATTAPSAPSIGDVWINTT